MGVPTPGPCAIWFACALQRCGIVDVDLVEMDNEESIEWVVSGK